MTALPAQTFISQQTTRKPKVAMLKAQFGDGYAQRAPDSLNPIRDGYNLSYENIDQSTRDSIWSVFNTVGTWDKMTFTPFGESTSKNWVFTEAPSETVLAGNIYTITVPIEQVFDLV